MNGVFIMKTKILCALIAVATSFGLFVGCSDNDGNNVTGSDDSLVTVPPNTAELKGESFDYKASACKEMLAKRYNGEGEEYIDFRIKDDGSAIVNIEMAMSCDGFVSMVYETRNDTLFATQNYTRVKRLWILLRVILLLLEQKNIGHIALALLTSSCISRQNLLVRNMLNSKVIIARLFTRRKSNLNNVYEKRWPASHLFLLSRFSRV